MERSRDITDLLSIMAALRHPETGCAWDVQQSFASIAPYTVEEAYEVVDAIGRGDLEDLQDELGDLLLQVVFHARIAEEQGAFDFGHVVEAITAKMIRRHPHVFGAVRELSPEQVKGLWANIKEGEKAARQARRGLEPSRHLDEVPRNHPALTQALKLQNRAAAVGFDWPDLAPVAAKVREEIDEVVDAEATGTRSEIEDEIGDLLFAVVNLARHVDVDPEAALRRGNDKFRRRFGHIETSLAAQGRSLGEATLAEMEDLWGDAKAGEKA
ncbi:nucleoside triphosphate pyrophosphohydrolase [Lichenihabitans sp. Uapishka_5]|uniref:nucleoside triphosphate pyrophosphohydrolase n=1 Tax=Lichenihabitans sp. Uapishka_5 TaxID=3037302 RepID=UPI0029E8287C|nr:nucleoside triphosphate pyrophosphohydrolase [Lichenihabitans sp. Uapishka_5]MDX7949861.1 nucleoside triphosphate pyrophosphohydrolase [Lichenihabitans sp. Uapishka_5]